MDMILYKRGNEGVASPVWLYNALKETEGREKKKDYINTVLISPW